MEQQLDNFDGDEDVIPEGSPLYQYLQGCGLKVNDTSNNSFFNVSIFTKVSALKNAILEYLFKMNWKSDQKSLRLIIGVHVLKTLTIKDIFVKSDHMLLIQGTENLSMHSLIQPSLKWRNFSILGALVSAWSISTKLLKKNSLLFNCSLAGLGILGIDMSQWFAQQLEPKFIFQLEELCQQIKHISSYCRKCIRYIQEFKMLNLNPTLAMQLDILQKFPNLQSKLGAGCSSIFKKNIYLLMKDIFLSFQNKTTELRDSVPLIDTYDLNSFYLSHIPLEELNFGFELDPIGDREQFDEYLDSKVNYKALFNLMGEQISEYFRRLCFCFLIDMPQNKSKSVVEIIKVCQSQLSCLEKESSKWMVQIKDLYELHASPEYQLPVVPKSSSSNPLLHSSLYSLYTHLRNLSLRVYDAHNVAFETEDLSAINSLMEGAKNELELIRGDVEHVFSLLPRPKQSDNNILKDEELKALPPPVINVASLEKPTYEDRVIVDEVFIGYSEPQPKSKKPNSELLYEEDVCQNPSSKFLLMELNKVLMVKAKEHSEREAKAIANAQGTFPDSALEDSYNSIVNNPTEEEKEILDLPKPPLIPLPYNNNTSYSSSESSSDDTPCRPKFQLPMSSNSFSASISSMAAQRFNVQQEVFADSGSEEEDDDVRE